MMRFFAEYTMRGRYQALLTICGFAIFSSLFLPFGLVIGQLSSALFALLVLRKGGIEGVWVLLPAVLILGFCGTLAIGNMLPGIVYGLILWTPVFPIAIVLRESRSLASAMETALGLGLAGIVGVYLMVEDPASLWREKLQFIVRILTESPPEGIDTATITKELDSLFQYFTGAVVGWSILFIVLGLFLARWMQATLFNPGGFRREFLAFRLHPVVVYAGVLCILTGLLTSGGILNELALNFNGVFMVFFTLCGISILHALLADKDYWVAIFYMALLLLLPFLPWLLPPIALLGISDHWMDWRKRMIRS